MGRDARAAYLRSNGQPPLQRPSMRLALLNGMEAEADVVGYPVAIGVAQDRLEERYGFSKGGGAIGRGQLIQNPIAEGVEPGIHTVGERRRARNLNRWIEP